MILEDLLQSERAIRKLSNHTSKSSALGSQAPERGPEDAKRLPEKSTQLFTTSDSQLSLHAPPQPSQPVDDLEENSFGTPTERERAPHSPTPHSSCLLLPDDKDCPQTETALLPSQNVRSPLSISLNFAQGSDSSLASPQHVARGHALPPPALDLSDWDSDSDRDSAPPPPPSTTTPTTPNPLTIRTDGRLSTPTKFHRPNHLVEEFLKQDRIFSTNETSYGFGGNIHSPLSTPHRPGSLRKQLSSPLLSRNSTSEMSPYLQSPMDQMFLEELGQVSPSKSTPLAFLQPPRAQSILQCLSQLEIPLSDEDLLNAVCTLDSHHELITSHHLAILSEVLPLDSEREIVAHMSHVVTHPAELFLVQVCRCYGELAMRLVTFTRICAFHDQCLAVVGKIKRLVHACNEVSRQHNQKDVSLSSLTHILLQILSNNHLSSVLRKFIVEGGEIGSLPSTSSRALSLDRILHILHTQGKLNRIN